MKIKNKKYKYNAGIISKQYTDKHLKNKFQANIFKEENGKVLTGELIGKNGSNIIVCKEDATLEDWIKESKEMYYFYHDLCLFLQEIHNNETKIL
jgi:ATP-dependent RNA circularization protein (DNA/RNA ligase family)